MVRTAKWRQFAARILGTKSDPSASKQVLKQRPNGAVVWVHVADSADSQVLDDLVARMTNLMPDIWFLVSANTATIGNLPENCIQTDLPIDDPAAAKQFVEHWQPSGLIAVNTGMPQLLVEAIVKTDLPYFRVQLRSELGILTTRRRVAAAAKLNSSMATKVLVASEVIAADFTKIGVPKSRIDIVGEFEPAAHPPECIESERNGFAQLLAARPVWLAAQVPAGEYASVIAAHMQALRRSHRLLLILNPADPADGDELAHLLNASGMTFAQRSRDEEPDTETQIYIADTDGEMGLWYRLAPLCYLGGTSDAKLETLANPRDAAALGSAMIHGPATYKYEKTFRRYANSNAAFRIEEIEVLGDAVELLLAPDKAAAMAHAAWQENSAGTEVTDHLVNMLNSALNSRESIQ